MGVLLLKLAGVTLVLAVLVTNGGEHALAVWAGLFVGTIAVSFVLGKLRQERDDANRPAYRKLLDISARSRIGRARFHQWDEAQRMLRDHYTPERAVESTEACAKRIEYLTVAEPLPAIEDFFPADSIPRRDIDHREALSSLQHMFELGCEQQRQREQARKKELAWAKTLHPQLLMTEYSRTSIAAHKSGDDQESRPVATVAETPSQLLSLMDNKPQYWVWAALASVLVQRRNALQPLLTQHRDSIPPAPRRVMTTTDELRMLTTEVSDEVARLTLNFGLYMNSPVFQRFFTDRTLYTEPSPETITTTAATVIDFYEANLLLARDTRRVRVEPECIPIIEDLAHLVDGFLETVDDLITQLVGYIEMLPVVARTATEESPQQLTLGLDLHLYNEDRLDAIYRQLDQLDNSLKRRRRRWAAPP